VVRERLVHGYGLHCVCGCSQFFPVCHAYQTQWRLNNRAARVRQQAADLISRIAVVMKKWGQEKLMGYVMYNACACMCLFVC